MKTYVDHSQLVTAVTDEHELNKIIICRGALVRCHINPATRGFHGEFNITSDVKIKRI
jgi:hypothetical protein